jgi:hypothetical protein
MMMMVVVVVLAPLSFLLQFLFHLHGGHGRISN